MAEEKDVKETAVASMGEGQAEAESAYTSKDDPYEKVHVWPFLVKNEFIAAILVTLIMTVVSIISNAPLREPADPNFTENPSKAPWYFVGLQEMLVYYDPWVAGVMAPTFIILGLMVIPYIDVRKGGSGYYTFSERRPEIIIFMFGFALWWLLIFIGYVLRGPSWLIYWPWESQEIQKPIVAEELVNLPTPVGVAGILLVYFIAFTIPVLINRNILKKMGFIRYNVAMFFIATMFAFPLKIVLRLAFNIRYIVVTPWFNI
jgi:hypothetical protein